jgi:hypothetical protein
MKKTLTAIVVIILSSIGLKAFASAVDVNVDGKVKEVSSENKGNDNESGRSCGSTKGK